MTHTSREKSMLIKNYEQFMKINVEMENHCTHPKLINITLITFSYYKKKNTKWKNIKKKKNFASC